MMKKSGKAKGAAKMMSYQKGGMVFKPCAGCPAPAKCRAAGKCLKKAAK